VCWQGVVAIIEPISFLWMLRSWQENDYSRGRAGEQSGLIDLIIMIDDRAAASRHRKSLSPRLLYSRVECYHVRRRPLACFSILWDISDLNFETLQHRLVILEERRPRPGTSTSAAGRQTCASSTYNSDYTSAVRWFLTRSVPIKRNKNSTSTGSTSSTPTCFR
jgi:hypothetical protein